jgi:hypothetical protein
MLGGASPGEHRHALSTHGAGLVVVEVVVVGVVVVVVGVVVVGVVVVGVVVVVVGTKWPIVIVTVLPFLAVEFPAGVCWTTVPFWVATVTGLVFCATLNPAAVSALTAPAVGSPVTAGTVTVAGVVATVIVTVEPAATVEPPPGLWAVTFPAAAVVDGWVF